MDEQHVYTVSELNGTARDLLESELGNVWLKGEISEISYAPSGHIYLTLKDSGAEISAVRFRGRLPLLQTLDVGSLVLAFGKLTVYEPRGRYQFVATLLQPVGAGPLQIAFEQLKQKLYQEGLFDASLKRPIPAFPQRIGVVTSPSGAAFRDIVSVLERRWPIVEVVLFPSSVQGDQAPRDLVAALDRAARFSAGERSLDLIILGRGGGSAEDLSSFNDETLARAVRAHPVPIVSAVGHEIDFAITDFVADLRAPTPSAAAELVAPDIAEVVRSLEGTFARMVRSIRAVWDRRARGLRSTVRASLFRVPRRMMETFEQSLDGRVAHLVRGFAKAFSCSADRLRRLEEILRLTDPQRPLERGYSLTYVKGSPTPLRTASQVTAGEVVMTRLARGGFTSTIEEVNQE